MISHTTNYRKLIATIETKCSDLDKCIEEMVKMDRELEKVLTNISKLNLSTTQAECQSIYAMMYSISNNVKANRAHYHALLVRLEAMDTLLDLYHLS